MTPLARTARTFLGLAATGALMLGIAGCGASSEVSKQASEPPSAPATAATSTTPDEETSPSGANPGDSTPEESRSHAPASGSKEGPDATSATPEPQSSAAASVPVNVDATPLSEDDQHQGSVVAAETIGHIVQGEYEQACQNFVFLDLETREYGSPEELGQLDYCVQILESSKALFQSQGEENDAYVSDPANYVIEPEQPGYGLVKLQNSHLGWLAVKLSDGRVHLAVQR